MKTTINTFRKQAVIILLFVVTSFAANAQTSKFNLLINEVNSYMAYRGSSESLNTFRKNYKGIQFGLSYQAGITKSFSIVNEFYFSIKGSVLKESNALTTGKSSLRVSTFELPVLARLHFGKLYVNAGPYASYLLSGRIKTEAYAVTPSSSTKLVFSPDNFNRWETGLQAGAGYMFNLKKKTLSIDFRYGYGLTSLSTDVERYNRTYVIGVRLGKKS